MTYTRPDLHPDDTAVRERIRARLEAMRYAQGLSRRQLGTLLCLSKGTVQVMEERPQWMVGTVQRWARALDQRLVITIHDLPGRAPDPLADIYAGLRPKTPEGVEQLERAQLRIELVQARRAAGVTQAELSVRLGLAAASMGSFERDGVNDDIALHTAQRYARGLGGRIGVALKPITDRRAA